MIMRAFRFLFLLILLAAPSVGFAVEPDEILPDKALESRARSLSTELRCLVCQNQSIDDSQAPLAKDLRIIVRERLKAGDSDDNVRSYLVQRYGDFILLKPPFKFETLLLWLTPLLALGLGGAALLKSIARRPSPTSPSSGHLTEQERLRVAGILDNDEP